MAHKKAGGSSRNGRDSAGQRLGVKKFGGEACLAGNIIVRQRGTQWHPGSNVGIGKDHTLFALIDGHIEYRTKAKGRVYVSVVVILVFGAMAGFALSRLKFRLRGFFLVFLALGLLLPVQAYFVALTQRRADITAP